MPERINAGQILVVVGAVALFVSLFLNWYEGPFAGESGFSAWTAFELLDIVLAGLALAAIAAAVPIRRGDGTATPISGRWLPFVGLAAFVLVAVTLLNDPPGARDRGLELGAWVALAGAAALAVGGLLGLARVSLVVTTRPTEPDDARTHTQPLH
ncbi:MAG TPA: hypothetical protein VE401_02960 [Solirubrobacterales bacterium]|nr:hypothetical protein [Solirubrobacterales bacterium]